MNEVDEYIKSFPAEVQERLTEIRNIIHELVPQATERICMRMPTYDLNGKWLVHFAGFKNHIGFYPQPEGIEAFKVDLSIIVDSINWWNFKFNIPSDISRFSEPEAIEAATAGTAA